MINIYEELLRGTKAKIKAIECHYEGDEKEADKWDKVVQSVNEYIFGINKPKDYRADNPENILFEMDRSFENLCASLEEVGIASPKKLTVFEFYQRVDYFETKRRNSKNE